MLLRQTLAFLPAQTIVPLSQLVAAFLWTFWLDPTAMGTYALIWSIQELIYLFILSWWSVYCIRYASTLLGDGKGDRFDRMEIGIQLIAAVIQTGLALLAVWTFAPDQFDLWLFLASLSFTLTRNISTHFATRARAQLEALPNSLNLGISSILGLLFGFIAVEFVAPTSTALLFAYAIAHFIGLAISFPFMTIRLRRPTFDKEIATAGLKFGGPLMVSGVFSWVGNHSIRFIVEYGAGRAAVGLMTVGWWMGLRVSTFVGMLLMGAAFNVAVERLRTDGRVGALQQLSTNAALLLGILVPSVVGILALGEQIVTLTVSQAYLASTTSILPLAIIAGAARVFREHGVEPTFLIFEKPLLPPLYSGLDAIATVAFCWIGLHLGGVWGAALGCALAAILAAAVCALMARIQLGYFVNISDVWRIFLAAAVMALALTLVPHQLNALQLLLSIIWGALVYGAAITALYPQASRRHYQSLRYRFMRGEAE